MSQAVAQDELLNATVVAPADGEPAMGAQVQPSRRLRSRRLPVRLRRGSRPEAWPHVLDPDGLWDYIDQLYRAAWALCGSRHDAEDLVQETFVNVLKRPRLVRDDNEIGYLLRALRNTHANRYRRAARQPSERRLFEDDVPPAPDGGMTAHDIMEAIADAPAPYRDAVIAVDLVGLSYREAARSLRTREATVATRLHRGRQHVAGRVVDGASSSGA